MLTRKVLLISVTTIPVAIAIGITAYFLNMPVWLIVERTGDIQDRHVIEIPESVLSDHPKLKEALDKADNSDPLASPGATHRVSFLEGKEIQEAIRNQDVESIMEGRDRRVYIENEGKQYSLIILFP